MPSRKRPRGDGDDARGPAGASGGGEVVKVENVRVLRDHALVVDDLWMENGVFIDPEARFWRATSHAEHDAHVTVDGRGLIAAPGFIDVQINGAFGVDFSRQDTSAADVDAVARGLLQYGVTAFCPTLVSSAPDVYRAMLPKFGPRAGSVDRGAAVLGAHLEGPFLSPQLPGAHDKRHLCTLEGGMAAAEAMYGAEALRDGRVKLVTLAPEGPGAIEATAALAEAGVVVSCGHSMASFEEGASAVRAGARLLTHLFNAMVPFHHRDPGLVGLLGAEEGERPFYGMIVDGIHCHRASTKMAYLSHPDGAVLVTDGMAALGLGQGRHRLGDVEVEVAGDRAVVAGTDTLAGAVVPMDSIVRRFRRFTECSVVEAIEAATLHPAQALGITDRKGVLAAGRDADFNLLDDSLNVVECYVGGRLGWSSSS